MKFAVYNIMSGGFDGYDAASESPKRLPLLKTAIKTLSADFIGLVDTFRWDALYTNNDLSRTFGYEYAACINLNDERLRRLGHNNGLTILSKTRLYNVRSIWAHSRNALFAEIEYEEERLSIVLVYLDDLSEDVRIAQVKSLLEQLPTGGSVIVMGDFNTLNRSDRTLQSPDFTQFSSRFPFVASKLEAQLQDADRGEVIDLLESHGFKDASTGDNKTFPSKLFLDSVDAPYSRIDHVFSSPRLKPINVRVPADEIFQQTSDHLPVTFKL
jgi:endonuclease/exonuclease/phosphatase family metal-dependent hydrolase